MVFLLPSSNAVKKLRICFSWCSVRMIIDYNRSFASLLLINRLQNWQSIIIRKRWHLVVGLGSIGTTSMDRQSRKIDVQHERTSIAELDEAPPYPQNTKEPTLFFKKTAALSRPPLKLLGKVWRGPRNVFYMVLVRPPPHFSKHYHARQNRIEKIDIEKNLAINRISKKWLMSTALPSGKI